jgi:hypothetical protein
MAKKTVTISAPPLPKKRRFSFTANCYALLGVSAEAPGIKLTAAERKTAERLVAAGMMEEKELEVEQEAGGFRYMAKVKGYALTETGKALYEEYNALVKNINPLRLRQAQRGEKIKERMIHREKRSKK